MPRPCLSTHLKNCKTFEVLLTKTTEEELLAHFASAYAVYEDRWRPYHERVDECVKQNYEDNPYRQLNWRKGTPKRKYTKGWEWQVLTPDNVENYAWLTSIRGDLLRCSQEFTWNTTQPWTVEFEARMQRCTDTLTYNEKELMVIDERNFEVAQQEWQTTDAEWIACEARAKAHRGHHPRAYYLELFAKDKSAEEWYMRRGGMPTDDETCELCIRQAQTKPITIEVYEEEQNHEQVVEVPTLPPQPSPTRTHVCDTCEYTTTNGWRFKLHMDSKEHAFIVKQKSLYCSHCSIQSRTQIEHAHHLTTNKHKKAAGELVVPTVWRCEPCGYSASLKQQFETHCKSKKHQAAIATSN